MTAVWQAFADARDLADPGYVGRQWNEATSLVLTGKAAGQIMGDWAQGEFGVAGKVAGTDYDCLPGLGVNPVLDTGGDAFYFPKNEHPEVTKAQLKLASMLVSKETQVAFNLAKGSLPIRGDVDMQAANACMQKGIKILADSNNVLPSIEQALSSDTQGQMRRSDHGVLRRQEHDGRGCAGPLRRDHRRSPIAPTSNVAGAGLRAGCTDRTGDFDGWEPAPVCPAAQSERQRSRQYQ